MVVTVNVVTEDAVLAGRLATYTRRISKLDILATLLPVSEERADAYVVPVDQMGWLLDGTSRPPTWLPVVAYGSEAGLGAAFLAGCRDYLRDPWTAEELSFRVGRLVDSGSRRTAWGNLRLTMGTAVTEHGEATLSNHEYRILRVLLAQLGEAVPREVLYYALWGRNGRESRAVDVHVSTLRRKLERIADPAYRDRVIRSARGLGYFIPSPPLC